MPELKKMLNGLPTEQIYLQVVWFNLSFGSEQVIAHILYALLTPWQ